MPALLSISEAAKYLGVAPVTLRLWERQGKISSVRTAGGQRRYSLEYLREYKLVEAPISATYSPDPVSYAPNYTLPLSHAQYVILAGVLTVLIILISALALKTGFASQIKGLAGNIAKRGVEGEVGAVLASQTTLDDLLFNVNINGKFAKDLEVIDKLTAPNILYGITAGDNITVTAGQNPTISTTDQTADLKIFGNVKVGSNTISASSKTDTLELAAGDNVTLSTDTSNKKITIKSAVTAATDVTTSGWTDDGTILRLTTAGDLVSIGSATGAAKLSLDSDTSRDVFTASQSGNLLAKLNAQGLFSLTATGFTAGLKLQNASTLFSAAGAPDDANGQDGDYYFRTDGSGNTSMYYKVGGIWTIAGGASTTLQDAYESGNSIATSNNRNLSFTLTNTSIDSNFLVNIATGSTGSFQVQDNGTPVTTLSTSGIVTTGTLTLSALSDGVLYTSSDVVTSAGIGSDGQVLTSLSGVPVWAGGFGSGTVGWFQRNSGVLSPSNITDDLAIGGTATSSALFQVIGTTGSASMSGTLTLGNGQTIRPAYGPLALAYKSAANTWATGLTLQDTTGNVGIGTTSPTSKLHVDGAVTGKALTIFNQTSAGDQNLLVASQAGTNVFTLANNGNLTLTSSTSTADSLSLVPYATAGTAFTGSLTSVDLTGAQTWTFPDATGTVCISGSTCATSGVVGFWQRNSGALSPANITDDLLIGATATSSAKFSFNATTGNAAFGLASPQARLDIKDSSSLATLGTEQITDSDDQTFTTAPFNWSGTGWTIIGGAAKKDTPTPGGEAFTLDNAGLTPDPVASSIYQIVFTFTTTATSSGSLTPNIGGASGVGVGQDTSMTNTQTQVVTASNTNPLKFTPTANWYGTIDDISVMKITPSSIALRLESSDGTDNPIEIRSGGSSSYNTLFGSKAGESNRVDGTNNNAFGAEALRRNTSGISNSAFGDFALYNSNGSQNIAFGGSTLASNTTGSNNIAIGFLAGNNLTTGSNNIVLGYDIDIPAANSSNTLNIGNLLFGTGIDGTGTTLSTGNIGIGLTTPVSKFQVNGAAIGKALVSLNETGDQNIFTASASGTTVMKLGRSGDLVLTQSGSVGSSITASSAPTLDMLSITNSGQAVATTGVEALNINYTGGSGAITGAGARINLTPGGTSGSNWYGLYIVAGAPASGVDMQGIRLAATLGAGSEIGILFENDFGTEIFTGTNVNLDLGAGGTGDVLVKVDSDTNLKLDSSADTDVDITTSTNGLLRIQPNGTGDLVIDTDTDTYVGLGLDPISLFDVSGKAIGKALSSFNETGDQNIFTASASGSTVFSIARTGNLVFEGSTADLITTTFSITDPTSTSKTITFPDASGTVCISGSTCASTGVVGFWQRNSGALSPANITDDLILGATATASAKFQVFADTGSATMSGTLTLGNAQTIRSAYGPLSLAYKSAANTWATGLTLQDTTGNVGIGTTAPTGKLDIVGTTAMDLPTYSAEFLSDSGWTSTNWTGDWGTGWTHTIGNTSVLSQSTAAVSGTKYQIAYTVTGATEGSFTIAFGGQSLAGVGTTGAFGPTTSSTANLTITPTTDFDGTIVISIKSITAISTPLVNLKSSDGTARIEIRANTGSFNTFIGNVAGRYNTTGDSNTALGMYALGSNTTGYQNTANGLAALFSNTTGAFNTALGMSALYSNTTGDSNIANGGSAGYNLTTGSNNIFLGYKAGEAATTATKNIVIGYDIDLPAVGSTNMLNIGNLIYATGLDGTNTTLSTGNVGIGTTSPQGKLHVDGAVTGKALTILNETGDQNILVASASGVTQATLSRTGDLTLVGDLAVNGGDITTTATTATLFNTTATTLSLGGAATTALNLGNGTGNYTAINIGSGIGTHVINIAGTGATAADTINIGTGGTGADTINLGSSASTTALNLTSGTGSQTFASSVATTSTTSSGWVFTDNSLTSGTGGYVNSNSITQGNLFQIATTTGADTLTSGNLLNISSDLANSTFTGNLASIDWSPDGTTEIFNTSADLLQINAGQYANVGYLLNITDNGSAAFTVSQTAITSALPHSFTAAGDVSMAYDLNFTNQTASYIKSNAPLYIVAGESFESNNLTLQAYNSGRFIFDTTALGGFILSSNIAGTTPDALFQVSGTKTGKALAIFNQTDATQDIFAASASGTNRLTLTSAGKLGIGTATPLATLHVSDSQTATASAYITNTNAAAGIIGLAIKLSSTTLDTTSRFVNFLDLNGVIIGKINAANTTTVAYTANGTDFAEYFVKDNVAIDAGSVVSLSANNVVSATVAYDPKMVGVVSNTASFVGGTDGNNKVLVALVGQIPVKIAASSPAIAKGDFVTSSIVSGRATKAVKPGFVIGKALEDWSPGGTDKIMVYIDNIWADPNAAIVFDESGNMTVNNISLSDTTNNIANLGSAINDLGSSMQTLDAQIASLSAQLADLQLNLEPNTQNLEPALWEVATESGKLTTALAVQVPELNVLGKLTIGLLTIDDLEASLESLTGEITVKGDLAVTGKIRILGDSIGKATIPAGLTELVVDTVAVSTSSSVFVTPINFPSPVSAQSTQSGRFVVRIPSALPKKLDINWWIVN